MIEVTWLGREQSSLEVCRVDQDHRGVDAVGRVEVEPHVCAYEMHADTNWRFSWLTMTAGPQRLVASRAADGWIVNGERRNDLAEAVDIDLAISPLSNTLPIRRLGLAIGQSADITTAYVTLPALTVVTDPQRYTRISERQYRYESRDSDFRRTITVDADGLVIDYPGLFTRVSTRITPTRFYDDP